MTRRLPLRGAAAACLLLAAGCAVGPPRALPETPHFRIQTQLPRRYDERLPRRFERSYARLAALFNWTGPAPWPGKADVLCYASWRDFSAALERCGRVKACPGSHGYQVDTGSRVTILLHSTGWFFHGSVFPGFAHEVTHAFLAHYAGPGALPAWVHEGLAQHFEFLQPEARPYREWQWDLATRGDPRERAKTMRRVLAAPALAADDEEGYAMAWRLVEELLAQKPGSFPRFIRAMKQGASPDDAMRRAYGWGREALIARCARR